MQEMVRCQADILIKVEGCFVMDRPLHKYQQSAFETQGAVADVGDVRFPELKIVSSGYATAQLHSHICLLP